MSLVESLGVGYCNEWLRNSLMVYEGQVYFIERFDGEREIGEDVRTPTHVTLRTVDSREYLRVSHEVFTGFAVLAYPELGYRKVAGIAYHFGRRQTAYRGLRPQVLIIDKSPASVLAEAAREHYLSQELLLPPGEMYKQIMLPEYDTPEVLDSVLQGQELCYVPNNLICIEPLHRTPLFGVYYKEKLVGTISRDRVLDISSPNIFKAVEAVI